MRDLIVAIERAGETAATALVTGETGAGEGLIARVIHTFSPRRDQVLEDYLKRILRQSNCDHLTFIFAWDGL